MLLCGDSPNCARSVSGQGWNNVEAIREELDVLSVALVNIEAEEVRRIKHLNRIATWAQQDPTGPVNAGGVRDWLLNELKAAMGGEWKKLSWQPNYMQLLDEVEALKAALAKGVSQ